MSLRDTVMVFGKVTSDLLFTMRRTTQALGVVGGPFDLLANQINILVVAAKDKSMGFLFVRIVPYFDISLVAVKERSQPPLWGSRRWGRRAARSGA